MMGSGDLSPDLNLEIVVPAASIRGAEGKSSNQDAEGKARRARAQPDATEDDDSAPEASGESTHQIDQLA